MTSFRRDGDVTEVGFAPEERAVLASLAASLAEMLEPEDVAAGAEPDADPLVALVGLSDGDPVGRPDDPALRRLLPDAYDDAEGAAEFRRLTDGELRAAKVANLRRIGDGAARPDGVVRIGPDEIDGWLAGLTDIRLVLGERLGMTEEREHLEDLDDDDPRLPLVAAYDWLSELQEVLVYAAMAD
ncbi:MAG: DUF2017 domain-containing protein [Frankiaceae bacterium]|nr:DUF2017 domain-containing protein [Frankiaceae bacterium]